MSIKDDCGNIVASQFKTIVQENKKLAKKSALIIKLKLRTSAQTKNASI